MKTAKPSVTPQKMNIKETPHHHTPTAPTPSSGLTTWHDEAPPVFLRHRLSTLIDTSRTLQKMKHSIHSQKSPFGHPEGSSRGSPLERSAEIDEALKGPPQPLDKLLEIKSTQLETLSLTKRSTKRSRQAPLFDHTSWSKRTSKLIDNNHQASGRVLAGPTMGRLNIGHAPITHADSIDKHIMKDDLNSEIEIRENGGK